MANETFQNWGDFFRQSVGQFTQDSPSFENKTPNYSAIQKAAESVPLTEKGYRIPFISRRPGGHTAFVPSASDFNRHVPAQTQSMYIFPTRYAMPMIFDGALIRALMAGKQEKLADFNSVVKEGVDAALKRIEQMMLGDGTGSLAYSATALTATGGGQTMTCTTSAAATPGQTKGAKWLEAGHYYDAVNPATGAVRGTLQVEVAGRSSCVVNVLTGTVASGDVITDTGAYNKYQRGLAHLISAQTRTLQGLSTATFPELNATEVDLNGALCTPSDFENVKAFLQTRNNEETAENRLLCFLPYGFYSRLKKQGWNMTIQSTEQTTGVAKRFVDGDTMFIRSNSAEEDRAIFALPDALKIFEEMPFGEYDADGQQLRMLLGANNTGSDSYQKAVGCAMNPGIITPKKCAVIKRALVAAGEVTEVRA